jgi:hypothetical protein
MLAVGFHVLIVHLFQYFLVGFEPESRKMVSRKELFSSCLSRKALDEER